MTLMTMSPDGSGWVPLRANTSGGHQQKNHLHEATRPVEATTSMSTKMTLPSNDCFDGPKPSSEEQSKFIQNLQRQFLAKQLECHEARTEASKLRNKLLAAELEQQDLKNQLEGPESEFEGGKEKTNMW